MIGKNELWCFGENLNGQLGIGKKYQNINKFIILNKEKNQPFKKFQ